MKGKSSAAGVEGRVKCVLGTVVVDMRDCGIQVTSLIKCAAPGRQ